MPVKSSKQINIRISIGISETEYGTEITSSTTRIALTKDRPTIEVEEIAAEAGRLSDTGLTNPDVLATLAEIRMEADEATTNPEAPGLGYDAQTVKRDGA